LTELRKTASNLADVVGGELLLRVANAAVAVLIGRVYGVAALGLYAAILAATTVAERIADNGSELTGIAEVSRNPQDLSAIAIALYLNKTVLSGAAIVLLAGLALVVFFPRNYWMFAAILVARTFLYSYCRLNAGLLKALNRTRYITRLQSVHFVLLSSSVLVIYLLGLGMTSLVLCLLGAQIVEFVAGHIVLCKLGLRAHFVSFAFCLQMLRCSTAIGATYTFSTLMLRGDVVVLSLTAGAPEVGAFAAANTGLVMVYVIAWLFSGVLLSDLGRLSDNRELFAGQFRKCIRAVLISGVPLAVVASVFARPVILFVFGEKFASAALPGALMMLALPFIFMNATFLSRAIALRTTRLSVGIYGGVAVLSLVLNYLGVRWYGAPGVAGSIVIREAVITLLFVMFAVLSGQRVDSRGPTKPEAELIALQSAQESSSISV
jgi:O-antigen/teichoic acid export membrane protein